MNALDPNFAASLDQADTLAHFRNEFHFPMIEGKQTLYFTGNSLGLMPKLAEKYLEEELEDWKNWGVEGHFHARRPWMPYHEFFSESLSKLVGAKPEEVVVMGSLTNNLHLLMVSFFQPEGKRTKILCEAKAFPSDQYALASQLRYHWIRPKEHLIEVGPREGEHHIQKKDFMAAIDAHGNEIAMMMIGGVNYYTGQVMDMKHLTAYAQNKGITVGWDLAHGAGNIDIKLHDWNVDFAAWLLQTHQLQVLGQRLGTLCTNATTARPISLVSKDGGDTIRKHDSKCPKPSSLYLRQKPGNFRMYR